MTDPTLAGHEAGHMEVRERAGATHLYLDGQHRAVVHAGIVHRLAACWEACEGLTTEEVEDCKEGRVGSANARIQPCMKACASMPDPEAAVEKLIELAERIASRKYGRQILAESISIARAALALCGKGEE